MQYDKDTIENHNRSWEEKEIKTSILTKKIELQIWHILAIIVITLYIGANILWKQYTKNFTNTSQNTDTKQHK